MACYYGCRTGSNKCAWFWWFLLIVAGVGCLVGWYVQANGCFNKVDACFEANGVNSNGLGFEPKILQEMWSGLNATDVCEAFFPNEPQQISGCVQCYDQVAPCFEPSLWLLVAGVVLAGASFLACLFMCCCASPPHEKYGY
eukprot:scaffold10642_cov42-Prasinocladus_malaysianus.AAC.1